MSDPKIRRFSGFQIAFHWLVAIPYMVLLLTGAGAWSVDAILYREQKRRRW